MRFVAFVCLSFVACSATVADDAAPPSVNQDSVEVLPEVLACPGADCSDAERIRHLLEAAKHLAAAGKHDDATCLRAEAGSARERLLVDKLAALANLQAEIAQLRGEFSAPAQICLEFKLIAYSSRRLRDAFVDLGDKNESVVNLALRGELLRAAVEHPPQHLWIEALDENDASLAALDRLCEQGLVKVVAEPKLLTFTGCVAQVQIGPEASLVLPGARSPAESTKKYREQPIEGIQIACRPEQLDSGAIRLGLSIEISHPSQHRPPESRIRVFNTATEIQPGQWCVTCGRLTAPSRTQDDETEFLILVKTSLVDPEPGLTEHSNDRNRMAERVRYDLPVAPSSRRKPHSPRPFQVPSYQTPIQR